VQAFQYGAKDDICPLEYSKDDAVICFLKHSPATAAPLTAAASESGFSSVR
jgi:hypothetical protein